MGKSKLLTFIQRDYKKLWPDETTPPKFVGKRRLQAEQQPEFLVLGKLLCQRGRNFYKKSTGPLLDFALVRWGHAGAWIVWSSQVDGILMSHGLVKNIQEICGQAANIFTPKNGVPEAEKVISCWGDLPRTHDYFDGFGSMLANVALTFVFCHELAHAGLGHYRIRTLNGLGAVNSPSGTDIDFISECGAATSSAGLSSEALITSQALEADADINGLKLTRRFVEHDRQIFNRTEEKERVDGFDKVWDAILSNDEMREFLIATGVAIGLLALSTNLETPPLGALDGSTHPPLAARLLVLLHVNSQFSRATDLRGEVILTAAVLIAGLLNHREQRSIQERMRNKNSRDIGKSEKPGFRIDDVLHRYSVEPALDRYNEIGEHYKKLGAEMKKHRHVSRANARLKDDYLYQWED